MSQQLRTILIIDDCQEDRDTYRRYLLQESRYTYQILEEQYGEDGLEVCRIVNPDVILLDFLLPDIDGLEFLEELRELTGTANLPVIMLTGQGNERIAVQAMKSGVQDYLVKNQTTPETLRLAIRNVLERSRLLLKLEESEERFRTSVENLLDAFGIYKSIRDPSGQIVDFYIEYVNAAACEAYQMTKEQQIGKRLGEILPVLRESGILAEYCRVVETGEPLVKESLVYPNPRNRLVATRAFDIRATRLGDRIVVAWRDITERQQAEEKIRQSQQFVERITETLPGVLYIYDLQQRHNVFVNPQIQSMIGYTPQEIRNFGDRLFLELMHPEDLARLPEHFAKLKALKTGEIVEFEYRLRHRNGQWRWLLSRETVFARTGDGEPRQSLGIATDITARRQTEAALRQSESRFRRLAESNIIGVVHATLNGNIIDANDAYLDLIGYTQADVCSRNLNWCEITPPEHWPRDEQAVQELKRTGTCMPFEKEYLRKDGSRVPILIGCALLGQESEQVVAFVLDLSDRKAAETALQESEQRFRSLADTIPQIIWTADPDGYCDYVNQRWCETTGLTFEQSLGEGWQQVLHPDDWQWYQHEGQEALRNGSFTEKEYRYRQADGSYRWYLVRALPIRNEQGQIVKWVGSSTDIEERKHFESERAQLLARAQAAQAEAEAANRAKDDFVAMVSHDLRAPLNAILGWATLLRTRPQVEAKTQQALETIERNAKAQAQLLEDLLDVSRMVQGRLQIDLRPIALQPIVQAALIAAYPTVQAKGIHLESELDTRVLKIEGDPHRLQQVLGNLLSNAVKFTPKGGRVKVYLERVAAGAQIVVSDTGKGISPELLPHVFDRFRQGKEVAKKEGLGLGLAIAQHLVELHGGTITAYSPGVGQGATFTICLPLLA